MKTVVAAHIFKRRNKTANVSCLFCSSHACTFWIFSRPVRWRRMSEKQTARLERGLGIGERGGGRTHNKAACPKRVSRSLQEFGVPIEWLKTFRIHAKRLLLLQHEPKWARNALVLEYLVHEMRKMRQLDAQHGAWRHSATGPNSFHVCDGGAGGGHGAATLPASAVTWPLRRHQTPLLPTTPRAPRCIKYILLSFLGNSNPD